VRADGGLPPSEPEFDDSNALLSSLGRLGREFQILLERGTTYEQTDASVEPSGNTLLSQLQRDIFRAERRNPDVDGTRELDAEDTSLTIHACHGEMRQVEVLQDQLLDLFAHNSDLEPSDVLVMTPDVETFAPLIEAAFHGQGASGVSLPVRIAGRSQRSENPLCAAVLNVLSLVGRRTKATQILDLFALAPIQEKFDLDDDKVAKLSSWVRGAQIRWGIDSDDRIANGQPEFAHNTWEWGLDRLLLGYAMPGRDHDLFGERLPYDEVEGSDAELLGCLADFCDTLFHHLRLLGGEERTLADWSVHLMRLVEALTKPGEDSDAKEAMSAAITALSTEAKSVGFDRPVTFDVPRAALEEHFDQSRAATSFLTGSITVCGMVPLRSIGHRVVCLLGLDDRAFPRASSGAGFDLAARRPALGDRNPREDDRYLFLEALLSARTHVRILYSGQSVRDNTTLPPSVVVSELLDDICQGYRLPAVKNETDEEARQRLADHLVVRHPLQAFSARYFGASDDDRLFSYASGYVEGARAMSSEPMDAIPFWDGALTDAGVASDRPVSLSDVERFFEQPVAALLKGRLGLTHFRDEDEPEDRESLTLDGLENYKIGAALLDQALAGVSAEAAQRAARESGSLPLGTPGDCALNDVAQKVLGVEQAVRQSRAGDVELDPVEIDLVIGERRLVGHVPSLWPGGQVVHSYASLKAKYLLSLWIRHLALRAHGADAPETSVIVTRQKDAPYWCATAFGYVDQGSARSVLSDLVEMWARGQSRPLLFFPATSQAYAEAYRKAVDKGQPEDRACAAARTKAASAWQGNAYGPAGERDDFFVARVFAGTAPYSPDFALPGHDAAADQTFHDVALRVFGPMYDAMVEVDR